MTCLWQVLCMVNVITWMKYTSRVSVKFVIYMDLFFNPKDRYFYSMMGILKYAEIVSAIRALHGHCCNII